MVAKTCQDLELSLKTHYCILTIKFKMGGEGQVIFLVDYREGHCVQILLGVGVIQNLNNGLKFQPPPLTLK